MTSSKQILVLGSQTFLAPAPKVGIQVIAEGLAAAGHEVHYLSTPSSPLDLLSKTRWSRLNLAWRRSGSSPTEVKKGLYEHVVRVPFPTNRRVWVVPQQQRLYPLFFPAKLKRIPFDLCLHDTSPTHLLTREVSARVFVLRLNDLPEGFSFQVPDEVTDSLVARMQQDSFAEIWSVSSALSDYARAKVGDTPVLTLSNGIDLSAYGEPAPGERDSKTAVLVGSLGSWVNFELLEATARALPEWRFDLYGPLAGSPEFGAANLHYRGVLEFADVPHTLQRYQVGLVPFKDISNRMSVVERPLKFYQYLAAGLGVASTRVGGLQQGMGDWAHYGATPAEFAEAVLRAGEDTGTQEERRAYLASYSWESILGQMMERLEALW